MAADTLSDNKLVDKVEEWYLEAEDATGTEREIIKENFRFYCGGDGQWDDAVIAKLDAEGKPHLSINKCMPTVNLISGYQRKFREQIDVVPRVGGAKQLARAYTYISKHALDTCRPTGDFAMSEMFLMGLIGGKWWAKVGEERTRDPVYGDLSCRAVSSFDILEDPTFTGYSINQNDPEEYCRYVIESLYLTLDQILLLWPEGRERIESIGGTLAEMQPDTGAVLIGPAKTANYSSDYGDHAGRQSSRITGGSRILTRRYHVKRCWWKSWRRQTLLVHSETGETWDMTDKTGSARHFAAERPDFEVKSRVVPTLHRTEILDTMLLKHTDNPRHDSPNYPHVRFCPTFILGRQMGMIDNLKDAQRELNKRRSAFLHHLNQSANSGLMAEEDSLVDTDNWVNNLSKAGFIGYYVKGKDKPQSIHPAPMAKGQLVAATEGDKDFDRITNINDAVRGDAKQRESGEALKVRRDQGLMSGEPFFDNFRYTQLEFFELTLESVRQRDERGRGLYSDEELSYVLEENDLDPQLIEALASDYGRYAAQVTNKSANPTVRLAEFYEMLELLKLTPQLAQEADIEILRSSDNARVNELADKVEQKRKMAMQQIMRQQQQQQQMMGVA